MQSIHSPRLVRPRRTSRAGAATVEFAIVAPVLFLTILSLMQFAGLLMSKNVLTNAAREGARVGSVSSTVSSGLVQATVEDYLARGGVDPSAVTVSVNPSNLADLAPGDELRIAVSAPINQMTWIWAIAPPTTKLTAEATYARE